MLHPKLLLFAFALPLAAADFDVAATATNQLGLDLLRELSAERPGENLVLSPYAIQDALALVYAGADATTRSEMARVLHFPFGNSSIALSFEAQRASIDHTASPVLPMEKNVFSRLYAQQGDAFRDSFVTFIRNRPQASVQSVDFIGDPAGAGTAINTWIGDQTGNKIARLDPADGVTAASRLVVASAFSIRARWDESFDPAGTRPRPFYLTTSKDVTAAFMTQTTSAGYSKRENFAAILVPYGRSDLQLLILVPDRIEGLDEFARKITPEFLRECTKLPNDRIALFLPKFYVEATPLKLGNALRKLGMKRVFDLPPGRASLGPMFSGESTSAPALSEVIHLSALRTDENGSVSHEPAGGNPFVVIDVDRGYGTYNTLVNKREAPPVLVDHPFLFAVLHRATGTCLLLGRVMDPR